MRAFKLPTVTVLSLALLAGCVAGQSLQTALPAATGAETSTLPPSTPRANTVFVTVTDDRAFVKSGDKPPYYLGKYRAGFGNPWDVKTENEEPLADILARDLATDLASIGYRVQAEKPADRHLHVSIADWNFDGYQNGKLWYDLRITVSDAAGKELARSAVQEATYVKGSFWMGARGGFQREMPKLYPAIIHKIVKDNEDISMALQGEKS